MKAQQLTSLKAPCCLSQSSITAAVDSNTRCAQNVGNLVKDGDVLPISCRTGIDAELQMHVEIPGTRIEMFINTNNWKEHFTACFSVCTRQGHWVAFRSGGGPPRHILAVWLNPVWVLLYPLCLHCSPSGTWLSVPPSCQPPPPPGDVEGELDVGPDKRNI